MMKLVRVALVGCLLASAGAAHADELVQIPTADLVPAFTT
jgi:hypothetical protein